MKDQISEKHQRNFGDLISAVNKRLDRISGGAGVLSLRNLLENAANQDSDELLIQFEEDILKLAQPTMGRAQLVQDIIKFIQEFRQVGVAEELDEEELDEEEFEDVDDEESDLSDFAESFFENPATEFENHYELVLTEKDLDSNPEFAIQGFNVGDTVHFPKNQSYNPEDFKETEAPYVAPESDPHPDDFNEDGTYKDGFKGVIVKVGQDEEIDPSPEANQSEAEETIFQTSKSFTGTKTKVTKKMLTKNPDMEYDLVPGDFVFIDGDTITATIISQHLINVMKENKNKNIPDLGSVHVFETPKPYVK